MTLLDLRMLDFEERGKPEYPVKNLLGQEKNQQQTQPMPQVGIDAIDLKPGHIDGKLVLSPVHHPCAPKWILDS